MSAVADAGYTLDGLRPELDETVEQFARRGLLWQNEVYSANAGHDLGMDWNNIGEQGRKSWVAWAERKFLQETLELNRG